MNAAVLQKSDSVVTMPGPCPVIITERLVLRPHKLSDAPAIAESLGDFKVSRMLSKVPQPYDRQDALDWIAPQTSGILPDWALAITTGDDTHIGVVAIELRRGEWHLGYWLNRFYWDRGYVTEAAGAALERFFRRMPNTAIRSGAFADNLASLNVQRKLGFRITDADQIFSMSRNRMVPHIETAMLPEDFRRLRRP
ncbi:RimJ/RimL family protein N-acetyltransferase [Rhizobium petrolearium]|uniref:GNAT family N-acetyltransferase n=1 Tax=Neorhizobium petrolearium TaxID=515361 RepID=UPI001AE1A439|nr:GNAT family N-acetyltransferase [Neorhizobium petrolearium]MBP1847123.1 RimJ/RimL family protein N-acetyltransferase [Neorhizobium petrolearium]